MNPEIDLIKITDAHELVAIIPLFDAYRQFYGQPPNPKAVSEYLHQRLSNQESVLFGARISIDGGVDWVGFTQLYPSFSSVSMRRVWVLNDLFVREDYRGCHIGKALVNYALGFAKTDGAVRLSLATAITNSTAQALYASLGFVKDETFLHYNLTF